VEHWSRELVRRDEGVHQQTVIHSLEWKRCGFCMDGNVSKVKKGTDVLDTAVHE